MGLNRMFAEAYILQTIGELDARTSLKVMDKLPADSFESIDEALSNYEREESIPVDVIEWIRASWDQAGGTTPKVFAKDILDDFLEALG